MLVFQRRKNGGSEEITSSGFNQPYISLLVATFANCSAAAMILSAL